VTLVASSAYRSLLAPTADLAAERAAHDEEPRPGVWAVEPSADLRALTQDETDILIRAELASWLPLSSPEHAEVEQIIGRPRCLMLGVPPNRSQATQQRGGIDSDPLVRILAWRAWGDRDRRWFDERGLRRGDRITLLRDHRDRWRFLLAAAYPGERAACVAEQDARPGTEIRIEDHGQVIIARVSARVREAPEQAPTVWLAPRG